MRKLRYLGLSLSLAFLMLSFSGCTSHYKVHPGAINTFDSYTFDSLYVAQTTIEKAKTQYKNSKDTKIKGIINETIAIYNITESAYITYHNAATPQNLQNLQVEMDQLAKAIAYLKVTLGVK